MLSLLFARWVDGLSIAFLWVATSLRRPYRFRLRSHSNSITLSRLHGSIDEPVFSVEAGYVDELPANLLEQTRNSTIEIVVPVPAIVQRRLDPLPLESLPFVDKVVLHQIESIFPWRSNDILHSIRTEKRSDGLLDIFVQATPRSAIEAELTFAKACNASEVLITSENQAPDGQSGAQILACIGPDKESKLSQWRLISRFAVIALLVSSTFVCGWTTYVRWSLSSDITALDHAIADRRALIKRGLDAGASAQSRSLEAKKRLSPPAVVVLEELSSVLPDGTYLTDLTLEGGRVRITGVSSNAVDLVSLLEKSGQFKNASFYAPTTRLTGSTRDRFSIEATMVLQSSVSP